MCRALQSVVLTVVFLLRVLGACLCVSVQGEKTSGYTSANDRSDVSGDEGDDVAAATLGNAVDNFVLPVVDHALLPRSVMVTNPASAHMPEGSTPGVAALCAATRATVLARDRSTAASTAAFRAARKHMTRVLASDKARDVGVEAAVFAAAQLVSYAVDVLRDPVLAAGFATVAVALLERLPGRATPLAQFVVAYAAQRSPAGAAALPESLRDKPCAVVGRVVGRCVVSLISAMSTSSPPDSLFDWLTEVGDDDDAVLEVVEAQVGLARALAQYNIPTMSLLHAALAVRAWRGGDGTTAKRHADKALRISWALIDAPSAITSLPLAALGSACASVIDKSRGASPRTDSQKTMLSTIRRHVQATALVSARVLAACCMPQDAHLCARYPSPAEIQARPPHRQLARHAARACCAVLQRSCRLVAVPLAVGRRAVAAIR